MTVNNNQNITRYSPMMSIKYNYEYENGLYYCVNANMFNYTYKYCMRAINVIQKNIILY